MSAPFAGSASFRDRVLLLEASREIFAVYWNTGRCAFRRGPHLHVLAHALAKGSHGALLGKGE